MHLEIENIGGIRYGTATIDRGINTIQASNWQGKSSFIDAVRTAFGTAQVLTEGESEGSVTLQHTDQEREVRLVQDGQTTVRHGTPVLTDEYDRLLVDLFAFLGDDNEVRRAVRNGDDLKAVLTHPLQLENLDERIGELRRERDDVETELERAQDKSEELVALKQQSAELESELEDLRDRKEAFERSSDPGIREELSDLRAERERVTDLIDRLERTLEQACEKLESTHEEYESLEVDDPGDLEAELVEVREEYDRAKQDQELLQSIYSANKRFIEDDHLERVGDVDHGLLDDEHACWLCGSKTSREEMSENIEALGEKVLDLRREVEGYETRIDELEDRRDEVKRQRKNRADLESRISELESTIREREESLASARDRLETIETKIADLSERVEETDDELSEIQSEIKYKEAKLEDIQEEMSAAASAADRIDVLEREREELTAEIRSLRNRRDEVQRRIRTEFDEAIRDIVTLFDANFETARLTSEFELVVARNGREVDLDSLSEGEVELLGLIVAVAGYQAYDVADLTPVVLLDQLGGLADDNLATLAEYLADLSESLVLTTFPENSSLGDNRIDPKNWDVVSSTRAVAS